MRCYNAGRTDKQTNEQLKIELLSQWKLEAEFRNISFTNILESSFCILFDCQMMKCAIFVGKQADLKYATDLLAFAHIAPSNSLSPPTLARNMIKQFCLILPESQMT